MDKVALITGASSGIGKSAAIELRKKGYIVYGAARRCERMVDLFEQGIRTIKLDVTDPENIDEVINEIIAETGRIDVLVNNAGFAVYGAVEDVPMDKARSQFEVNLFGLSEITRKVLPYMRALESGRIINISSIGGKIYSPYGAYYHASKFALEGFSDCLRYELKPYNIKVVVIQPGIIRTEWSDIASDSLLENSKNGAYAEDIKLHAKFLDKTYDPAYASKPDVIGRLVAKAATTKNPSTRYAAGKLSSMSLLFRRLFSDKIFDWVLRKQVELLAR
ncbi:MAG: SDR family NAD(P)-dependent oxidoreductase [Bacteroidales bacterium]|nr:SDR family NAD(P)-dependent oxidoreductase [Bacteroidales bacterium]MBN2821419.1 SDR family NAD(P)-dependent oxidoreductase [Bacteroidales bacterium]